MLKTLLIAAFFVFSTQAYAGEQVVRCEGNLNGTVSVLDLLFTDNSVQVLGDKLKNGESNVGYLADPNGLRGLYLGLTLDSEVFGWQKTYAGNDLEADEARLLVNGDDTIVIEFTNAAGKLDHTTLNCDAI